jgi:hypothetical protein
MEIADAARGRLEFSALPLAGQRQFEARAKADSVHG